MLINYLTVCNVSISSSPQDNDMHHKHVMISIILRCMTTCSDVLLSRALIEALTNVRDESSMNVFVKALCVDSLAVRLAEGLILGVGGGMIVPSA